MTTATSMPQPQPSLQSNTADQYWAGESEHGRVAARRLGWRPILVASVAAVVGAGVWTVLTMRNGGPSGFGALVMGLLVGLAVRESSRRGDLLVGALAAVTTLIGIIAANLLTIYVIANELISVGELDGPITLRIILAGMNEWVGPIELMCFVAAVMIAFAVVISRRPRTAAR